MKKSATKTNKKNISFSWTDSSLVNGRTGKILIVYLFLFLGTLFVLQPNFDTETQNDINTMQFHGSASEWWIDESTTQSHGAADKWNYLFDETNSASTGNLFTWDIAWPTPTVQTPTASSVWIFSWSSNTTTTTKTKYAKLITGAIPLANYYVAPETLIFSSDLAQYYLENFLEWDRTTLVKVETKTFKNCLSPRWDQIVHKDFVIAYQQRTDVDNICNIEKRYCHDGILNGSYTGHSCAENVPYEYSTLVAVSYTQKKPSEYIQPNPPRNQYADFSSQWKINETLIPITSRDTEPSEAIIVQSTGVELEDVSYPDCRAPWREKVKNGQFVKAYQFPLGFTDRACAVEIRLCVDGKLKGKYKYKSCSFTGTSL